MSEVTDLVLPLLQRMQAQMNSMERQLDVVMDDVQLRMARIERRIDLTDA